jgi:hypothetical protein
MPSSVVFLGPSLSREEASAVLNAEFLPPIKRGDVSRLLRERVPDAIGVVDGQFLQSFSISPKEILQAIEAGVRVFGASSMGVLRAVELEPYGMTGVGQIYRLFASGELDADDEVAMIYDSGTLQPVSVPLVNMRVALAAARERGLISEETERLFIEEAKKTYFPERTYNSILAAVGPGLPEEEVSRLRQFLATSAPDAKREDALELLRQMKSYLTGR